MRNLIGALLAAFMLAVPTALSAVPAQAHTVPCVSKAEFHQVVRGMRMARAHAIFDVSGVQDYYFGPTRYSPAEQGRRYRACTHSYGSHGIVYVDYVRRAGIWKLREKNGFW